MLDSKKLKNEVDERAGSVSLPELVLMNQKTMEKRKAGQIRFFFSVCVDLAQGGITFAENFIKNY
jgi:hypothetical protein